jgi:hypothetical protein
MDKLSLFSIGLSALLLFMASDDPFHFCPLGCLSFSLLPLMSPFSWTKERGVIRCHKEKKGRHPNGQKRKGSSDAIKRRRIDNPMDKRKSMASDDPFLFCPFGCLSFSLWPLVTPFSFVRWVVSPSSFYGL